ncbi:MAG: hypothetical protein AABX83_00520 [Nanoarchaeota archaeon]
MKTLKEILGVPIIACLAGYISSALISSYKSEPKAIEFRDMDEDGKDDLVISTKEDEAAYVFLERDGKYVKFDQDYSPVKEENKEFTIMVEDNIAKLRGLRMER